MVWCICSDWLPSANLTLFPSIGIKPNLLTCKYLTLAISITLSLSLSLSLPFLARPLSIFLYYSVSLLLFSQSHYFSICHFLPRFYVSFLSFISLALNLYLFVFLPPSFFFLSFSLSFSLSFTLFLSLTLSLTVSLSLPLPLSLSTSLSLSHSLSL